MAGSPSDGRSNKILKFAWNCIFVLLYPIITTFSLLFMGIVWLFSRLSTLLSKIIEAKKTSGLDAESKKPVWKSFLNLNEYKIQRLFIDEVMFGPTYFKFRSEPSIPALEEIHFGDFIFECFDGVLLQKWNSSTINDLPDFTLVYLDGETGQLTELEKIKSFSWNASMINENTVNLKWFNGISRGDVLINKKEIKK